MPRPFVAYLRVYEPLSAFDAQLNRRLREVIDNGALPRAVAVDREREMWFRSQLSVPPRLLPGESADGHPLPSTQRDVLVLDPATVPGHTGTEPLVCPLDLMARSAAALVGFLAVAHPTLREAAVTVSPERVRARAAAILTEQTGGAVHTVSTTWTVPLPWFVMFDPARRRLVLAPRDSAERECSWRASMADARARVDRAYELSLRTFGAQGPAKVLADTAGWLGHFHPDSAVELDYGGLVQLLDDTELTEDSSAVDVNAIVEALADGNAVEVTERFERLRDFWGELAMRERCN